MHCILRKRIQKDKTQKKNQWSVFFNLTTRAAFREHNSIQKNWQWEGFSEDTNAEHNLKTLVATVGSVCHSFMLWADMPLLVTAARTHPTSVTSWVTRCSKNCVSKPCSALMSLSFPVFALYVFGCVICSVFSKCCTRVVKLMMFS